MWGAGGLLLEDSTEVRPSRATRSPERDLESAPSLSEAASAIVKEEVDGEAAVVASAQEPLTILALDDDDIALWDSYLHGNGTPQPSAASIKPNLKDMLVTPAGSKKASVQLNTEAEQVRNIQRWTLLWTLGCEKFLPGLAWLLLSKTGPLFSPSLYVKSAR